MHPTLDELLAARDSEGDATVAAHVAACPSCSAQLERLAALPAALAALPVTQPEHDIWPSVRTRLEQVRFAKRWARFGWVAAGFAIVVTLAATVRGGIEAWHETRIARETGTLVAESQSLEERIRALEHGSVLRGRRAGTILEIEDRIATVDARLAGMGGKAKPTRETADLWRERVMLLGALVDARSDRAAYVGL
jgi:hypothetical protein